MMPIPFRTFNGFLKHHAHEALTVGEQELFDILFPEFQGTADAQAAYEAVKDHPFASSLSPFVKVAPGERRPRRYAGFDLPRSRYFSVCHDAAGHDDRTLSHELQAYRNPVEHGMIEVVDLARGCVLKIGDNQIELAAEPSIVTVVHEASRLPEKYQSLAFKTVPGLTSEPAGLFRFPYRVDERRIGNAIDLRYPEVRQWFFDLFQVPSADCDALVAEYHPPVSHTTALSRFHFENEIAPAPKSFWDMLPTLLNPDRGGGNPADTGSTLVMIGQWLRQHGVSALVFPSARCDVQAMFQKGELVAWRGWNLVDYRGTHVGPKLSTTIVTSPWAWTRLPDDVQLRTLEAEPEVAGSFQVENMVEYWEQDYSVSLKALEFARSKYGREKSKDQRGSIADGLAARAYQIGRLTLQWLRLCQQGYVDDAMQSAMELQGLALPYDLHPITGRVMELFKALLARKATIAGTAQQIMCIHELEFQWLKMKCGTHDLDKLARLAGDIEMIMFFIIDTLKRGQLRQIDEAQTAFFLEEAAAAIDNQWLDEPTKERCRSYQRHAFTAMSTDNLNRLVLLLNDGELLHFAIDKQIRAKETAPTHVTN